MRYSPSTLLIVPIIVIAFMSGQVFYALTHPPKVHRVFCAQTVGGPTREFICGDGHGWIDAGPPSAPGVMPSGH